MPDSQPSPTDTLSIPEDLDPDEVLEIICSTLGSQAIWYELGDKGNFELSVPGKPAMVKIQGTAQAGGIRLGALRKGPAFDPVAWGACRVAIQESVVESTTEMWQAICFQ